MQDVDKKIRLIMRLNSSLKRLELFILANKNAPAVMQGNTDKAILRRDILTNVLSNLNYLNY